MARIQTVDEYVAASPDDLRPTLAAVRAAIQRAVPDAVEGISYGMPAYGPDGRFAVWFAGWRRHISVYPIPSGDPSLAAELAPYVAAKGTLRFPLAASIPFDLIGRVAAELVREQLTRER
jgi:uncharacterized protein YdhG (YjbR/CyaY superfamily)